MCTRATRQARVDGRAREQRGRRGWTDVHESNAAGEGGRIPPLSNAAGEGGRMCTRATRQARQPWFRNISVRGTRASSTHVTVLRRQLLKLLRVREFGAGSEFVDMCLGFTLPDVICTFCNDCRDLDLCRDDALARHSWLCRVCGHEYHQVGVGLIGWEGVGLIEWVWG
eukprot:350868-Chlamydomonas_euryale.AAC.1